jgi:hypothetical protein
VKTPSQYLQIRDPYIALDFDRAAFRWLRENVKTDAEMLAEVLAASFGASSSSSSGLTGGQEVYVDGQYRGPYQGPHVDNEFV